MERIQKYRYGIGIGAGILSLAIFLVTTNPDNVSVGILVVPVVLLFLITFCIAQLVLTLCKILPNQAGRKRTVALLSASLLTIIMILQSTGGISVADVVLLGLIITVAGIYISKF